jgi:hypothetical protein
VTENDLEVWQQLICKENWNLSITKEEPWMDFFLVLSVFVSASTINLLK